MFKPYNRHLYIETFEQDSDESATAAFVPSDYKVAKEIEAVRIVSMSDDCTLDLHSGDIAIVEGHMIKSLELGEETVHVILENYVLGTYNAGQDS